MGQPPLRPDGTCIFECKLCHRIESLLLGGLTYCEVQKSALFAHTRGFQNPTVEIDSKKLLFFEKTRLEYRQMQTESSKIDIFVVSGPYIPCLKPGRPR